LAWNARSLVDGIAATFPYAEEQEAASEKHGRKKPVFQLAEAVAQDADEP
jgi:hypothetical protein